MDRPVYLEVHNYLLAHLWRLFFLAYLQYKKIDLVLSILHKIYSMQRIVTHIKKPIPLLNMAIYMHLHPEYAVNLVASSEYYHSHWTIFIV